VAASSDAGNKRQALKKFSVEGIPCTPVDERHSTRIDSPCSGRKFIQFSIAGTVKDRLPCWQICIREWLLA
ncbi:MAG: hypothetical protein OEY04_12470, partial [Gammaproteobacteria bacterium]|nr:hypothetical protein [Gammaproteobacteria bacterium]